MSAAPVKNSAAVAHELVEGARAHRERAERVREARVLGRRKREVRQPQLAQAAQPLHRPADRAGAPRASIELDEVMDRIEDALHRRARFRRDGGAPRAGAGIGNARRRTKRCAGAIRSRRRSREIHARIDIARVHRRNTFRCASAGTIWSACARFTARRRRRFTCTRIAGSSSASAAAPAAT